jgi:hypothetical protein
MQLEGSKRKRLNHSIIDYIQSIIMTNDEYLQALEEKVIKKKKPRNANKKDRSYKTRQERKKSTRKGNSKNNKV